MKYILFCALFIVAIVPMQAKPVYAFAYSTGTYQNLVNDSVISGDLSVADYSFTLQGKYKLFGQVIDNGIDIGRNGYIVAANLKYGFAVDPFLCEMVKKDNSSAVSILVDKSKGDGNNILKVQWKNMGLKGNPASDFVNVQAWINQSDQSVEFHYGPCQVTDTVAFSNSYTPQIIFIWLNSAFTQSYESHSPGGESTTPVDLLQPNGTPILKNIPSSGMIYRYSSATSSVEIDKSELPGLKVYPSPASDILHVDLSLLRSQNCDYAIYDIHGRLMERGSLSMDNNIFTGALSKGIYFLRLIGESDYQAVSFIKN